MEQTRAQRVTAVANWLRVHYPTAYPVDVRWVPKLAHDPIDKHQLSAHEADMGIYAICDRQGRRFKILLSKRRCRTVADATETLIHEWAHAVTWGLEGQNRHRPSGHDDQYWLVYGGMYRHYYEGTGWSEVRASC